jgi:cyclopropane-fatty-acyl-phospholipid synthase
MSSTRKLAQDLLAPTGVIIDGPNPWDPQIHDDAVLDRLFREGTIAVGESYMDGVWDVDDLPEMIARVMRAGVGSKLYRMMLLRLVPHLAKRVFFNLQSKTRAFQVGQEHYDAGNDLFEKMLDPTMTYTCAYWKDANTLEEAQNAKLDLVCRKIGLKPGDRILDIGCGWGSFLIYAAKKYGVSGVGITVSKEQAELARERVGNLPVEIRVQDYRDVCDGPYDKIVSLGMFEHVGKKNYRTYMQTVRNLLKEDGLFLLHTIGSNRSVYRVDPWIEKYVFKNGYIPSPEQMGSAIDKLFVLEDWHNFGTDYERTLMAWWKNFDEAWPDLEAKYGKRFYRMWKFYLQSCAGGFRGRYLNLWQIVLSPKGVPGGYTSVR